MHAAFAEKSLEADGELLRLFGLVDEPAHFAALALALGKGGERRIVLADAVEQPAFFEPFIGAEHAIAGSGPVEGRSALS